MKFPKIVRDACSSEGDFLSWSFASPVVVDVGFMFPSAAGKFVGKASNSSMAFLESELPSGGSTKQPC